MKKVITLLILIAAFVNAQNFTWVWQNPQPQGNALRALNVATSNIVIIFGDRSVVLRTLDGGATWQTSYADPNYRNIESSCFTSATTGYACGDDGLIVKTTDSGNSFTVLNSGTTEDLIDIDFIDADSGYVVGASGTIRKTTNGGTTWNSITSPITNSIYTIHIVSPNNIFIGTASANATQYLSRSTDYGNTWVNVTPTGFNKTIWDIDFIDANNGWFASQDGGKVYYTTNGGTNWTGIIANSLVVPNCVKYKDALVGFITNNNNGKVYRSADGGLTYTETSAGTEALYCVDFSGNTIYAVGRYGSIYKSVDNGINWTAVFNAVTQKALRYIRFSNSTTGYAGGGSSTAADSLGIMLKTTNGGNTWTQVGYNFKFQVYSFAIPSPNVWYVGNGINQIYKTTDGGLTFNLQPNPIASTTTDFNDMSFIDENTGYAVSSGGKIIKTTNGGTNWIDANSPFGTSGVWSLYTPNANKVIAVGASAKAFMTTNGGTSWTAITPNIPGTFFCTRFYTESFGLIAGFSSPNPVLSKTTDGGLTWTEIPLPTDQGVSSIWGIGFKDINTFWLSDVNGVILYTDNGGSTWNIAKRIAGNTIFSIAVVDGDMWMAGNGGTILKGYSNPNVPVELTSFTANSSNKKVELAWTTATETNNRCFEIERKSKSETWKKIAFIEGKGTSTVAQQYSYTDVLEIFGEYTYRLKQIDFDGTVSYSNEILVEVSVIENFDLKQNFPNPFNPNTVISYSVPVNSMVKLTIFDIMGAEVKTIVNEMKEPGSYSVSFDASSLSSGVYFYELNAGQFNAKKKMLLLK